MFVWYLKQQWWCRFSNELPLMAQRGGSNITGPFWIIHWSTCWHGGLRTTYKSHSCWFPPVWTTRPAVLQMLHTSVCERPAAFRDFSSSRLRLKRRETHKQGGCCYLAHRNKTQLLPLPLPVWGLMGKWVSEEFWLVCNWSSYLSALAARPAWPSVVLNRSVVACTARSAARLVCWCFTVCNQTRSRDRPASWMEVIHMFICCFPDRLRAAAVTVTFQLLIC